MEYTVKISELIPKIEEELSREAMIAADKDGRSLYDALRPLSRDKSDLQRYIADGVNAILVRFWDCCHYHDASTPTLVFDLPDFDGENTSRAEGELDRYIVLSACAAFLIEKNQEKSKTFADRATMALSKAVTIMRARI